MPLFSPIYPLSKVEQLALQEFLEKNLANQFICPSQSPMGAPILFIKKKDGSLYLTVNYCSLNKITKKDRYPPPLQGISGPLSTNGSFGHLLL